MISGVVCKQLHINVKHNPVTLMLHEGLQQAFQLDDIALLALKKTLDEARKQLQKDVKQQKVMKYTANEDAERAVDAKDTDNDIQ
ncbi:unnamed protein product [Didymodactylos carnosus]|uniref:Uncharacterized protein n=1 Tax=Didymodactylos carnosus TaxID=1234261 RepID=A0A815AL86_9BILA|nr:unnamed protein product [Didymodactylos carnosus]CAF4035534.1 unnamed protein product [Didymodactylos carnosus]